MVFPNGNAKALSFDQPEFFMCFNCKEEQSVTIKIEIAKKPVDTSILKGKFPSPGKKLTGLSRMSTILLSKPKSIGESYNDGFFSKIKSSLMKKISNK